jgi:hypothetical protein
MNDHSLVQSAISHRMAHYGYRHMMRSGAVAPIATTVGAQTLHLLTVEHSEK